MNISVIEATYPISFREADAKRLGEHLRRRQSINLVGMKRVGISNFLRFFLFHKEIVPTYISREDKHLFISVDLNDLVEREIYPFWVLTFKRISDASQVSSLPQKLKQQIEHLFSNSIQSQDLFLLIDGIRQSVRLLCAQQMKPTIFFLRFDRMRDVVTPSFFDNLQGLKDASGGELAYVFTSYRSLDMLAPHVFTRASLSVFAQTVFLKPATLQDSKTIYAANHDTRHVSLPSELEASLFHLVNGYVQYLQLALLILHERKLELPTERAELFSVLRSDERITLQSEELWESLSKEERGALIKILRHELVSDEERQRASYLWDTGFVHSTSDRHELFSELFAQYLTQVEGGEAEGKTLHFSKKEQILFDLLLSHLNELCEREMIVNAVWPEYHELGVSDWAVDRLVSRVRLKLKQQGSPQEIQTIRTRGYKLTAPHA